MKVIDNANAGALATRSDAESDFACPTGTDYDRASARIVEQSLLQVVQIGVVHNASGARAKHRRFNEREAHNA